MLHQTGGVADGYLFASEEDDGSLYCEEALAVSALVAYHADARETAQGQRRQASA
ncbi:MAG: hypothetical protein R2881_02085 [Eubacteriales bacterium]